MQATYHRKGKTLINIETGEQKAHKSINEAKRESAKLQRANGGLGAGYVTLK